MLGAMRLQAPPTANAYSAAVLADTPIGYWKLDDPSGTTATDSSGNGYSGTYTGGFSLQGGPSTNCPTATEFNGSTGYVTITHNGAFNVTSDVTWEAWFYAIDTSSHYNMWFSKGTGLSFYTDVGTAPRPLVADHTTAQRPSATVANLTTWYHVAYVRSAGSGNGQWYVNGSTSGSAGSFTVPTNSTAINIGRRSDGLYMSGRVCHVALYGSALSEARIQAHYDAR